MTSSAIETSETNRVPRLVRRIGITAVAGALLAGAALSGTAAATPSRPDLQATVQAIADTGFAGVQVRVHDERGDWIGSNTKTLVSTLVLQLVDEGKVGLDAPVADYLPEYGIDRRITVRMLLQHTSGLFDYVGAQLPDGTSGSSESRSGPPHRDRVPGLRATRGIDQSGVRGPRHHDRLPVRHHRPVRHRDRRRPHHPVV